MKPITPLQRRLAIILLSLVAYAPTLTVGFMWDDHVMIEGNPRLGDWSAAALRQDFSTDVFLGHGDPYYRPAQTLLNRLDYALWGLKPIGYHLTNFLAHTANALLVVELAIAIGFLPMAGLLAGCLFAVHPIGVEQLLIIAGRAELFSLTFILAGLLLLLSRSPLRWALGHAFWCLALFTKESSLVAPALGALVFWFRKDPRSSYQRLLPFVLYLLPYIGLRQAAVGSLVPRWDTTFGITFFVKAFPGVVLQYVQNMILPWNLHSHREMPRLNPLWPTLFAGLITWVWMAFRRKWRLALFVTLWILIVLIPKAPIMMYGNFMLDHWAYPAMVAIALLFGWFFAKMWDGTHTPIKHMSALMIFPLLIGWALMTRLNIALRGSDEKMYRWALNFTTSNPIHYNLGVLLLQSGRPREAMVHFVEFHKSYPNDPGNLHALAQALWLTGDRKIAIKTLEALVARVPTFAAAQQTLSAMKKEQTK